MTILRGVTSARIKAEWPKILPFVERALKHDSGRYSVESIYKALINREMQLQCAMDGERIRAICITELRNYPTKRVGTIFLCAGDGVTDWLPHLAEIEDWMRSKGCKEIDIYGRPGWAKLLPDYQFARVMLRKEL